MPHKELIYSSLNQPMDGWYFSQTRGLRPEFRKEIHMGTMDPCMDAKEMLPAGYTDAARQPFKEGFSVDVPAYWWTIQQVRCVRREPVGY